MAESSDIITIDSLEMVHKLVFIHMLKNSYELAEEIFKQYRKKEDDPNYEKELKELVFEILNEKINMLEDLIKN